MNALKKIIPVTVKQNLKWYFGRRASIERFKDFEMSNPGDYKSMNCFHYYKCYFVHIPKTGGKSISKSLFGNYSGGHSNIAKYYQHFGQYTFSRYFKFAFVRNPWDRLFSAYNYFLKSANVYQLDKKWEIEYLFYKQHLSRIKSFEQFVMEWLGEDEILNTAIHFLPQHHMLTFPDNRNKIQVDFVGRFESIDEDFKIVCKMLNREFLPLIKINVTDHVKTSFVNVYSNEMIDKVGKLYAKDIELFNYTFPLKNA